MQAVSQNHLIIRTSFCQTTFPFEKAFVDKFTSQDYVDKLAPKILEKCLGSITGVIHIGHKRRSFYELAQERNSTIEKGTLLDIKTSKQAPILVDTSLEIDK